MQRDSSVAGIDLAKHVLHLVGSEGRGKITMRKRCSRGEVVPVMANLSPATLGMEAWGGAHDWVRHFRRQFAAW